jgi:hypothetical protein
MHPWAGQAQSPRRVGSLSVLVQAVAPGVARVENEWHTLAAGS